MFSKKFMIFGLLIIILITIIVYRFYKYNKLTSIKGIENFENLEAAESETENIQLRAKAIKDQQRIRNLPVKTTKYPIKDYCYKASLNSAVSGKYVGTDMVKEVLSRGCRFLDFEVFYIKENEVFSPRVAMTKDYKFISIDTENSVPLVDIFNSISTNAFSQISPNNKDPIFIHLRIKSNDTKVYDAVGKNIKTAFTTRKQEGLITEQTKLDEIMGKVIIVMDKTIRRDYKDYSNLLHSQVNLESGSESLNQFSMSTIMNTSERLVAIDDNNLTTDLEKLQMVMPNAENYNTSLLEVIYNFGIQIYPAKFYAPDAELEDYEDIFNQNSHGIVPMGSMMYYLQKRQTES